MGVRTNKYKEEQQEEEEVEEKEGEAAAVALSSNPRSNTYFPLILRLYRFPAS